MPENEALDIFITVLIFWRGLEDGRKIRAGKRDQLDDETMYVYNVYLFPIMGYSSSGAICDPSESDSITVRLVSNSRA